jgi:hypothetical protein
LEASNQNVNGGGNMLVNPQQQPQQQQQQQQHPQEQTPTAVVQEKFKGLLKQAKDNLPTSSSKKPLGPNLGFKPTAAMAQRHEDALVSGKRPLYQFQVRPYCHYCLSYRVEVNY